MVNNKEKKSGFNIIDLIIILFVVLAAVGIVMRYNLAEQINLNANGETFEIEFMTGWNVQEASQQYFRPGVSIYYTLESMKIGEITEILDVRNPAVDYGRILNGDLVKIEIPERIDIYCVMQSTGRITNDGDYMINGNTFVAPNKELFIHTSEWEGWIRILSVKKVNE